MADHQGHHPVHRGEEGEDLLVHHPDLREEEAADLQGHRLDRRAAGEEDHQTRHLDHPGEEAADPGRSRGRGRDRIPSHRAAAGEAADPGLGRRCPREAVHLAAEGHFARASSEPGGRGPTPPRISR